MRRLFVIGLTIVGVGIVFVLAQRSRTPAPVPAAQQGQTVHSAGLPEPLHIQFAAEIPEPNNPCSNLTVSQDIQQKRQQIAQQARGAEQRAKALLAKVTLPLEIERGDPLQKKVALTIDTGTGGAYGTEELLLIAAHYKIPLTFFLTGCWVIENPELTQKIVQAGHTIANHSLTHVNLGKVPDEKARYEISEADRIIKDVVGFSPVIFRKPHYAGGERITNMAGELGKVSVQGFPNFGDTAGWRTETTAQDVAERVVSQTAPGAVWVFHNLSPADLGAFEDVVRFHLEEHYTLVTVEGLIFAPHGY